MIAYPIGSPIGSRRVCPNRPRIARVVSCRVNPSFSKTIHVPHGRGQAKADGSLRSLLGGVHS